MSVRSLSYLLARSYLVHLEHRKLTLKLALEHKTRTDRYPTPCEFILKNGRQSTQFSKEEKHDRTLVPRARRSHRWCRARHPLRPRCRRRDALSGPAAGGHVRPERRHHADRLPRARRAAVGGHRLPGGAGPPRQGRLPELAHVVARRRGPAGRRVRRGPPRGRRPPPVPVG